MSLMGRAKAGIVTWLGIAPPAPTRAGLGMPVLGVNPKGRQSRDDPSIAYLPGLTYLAPFSADERWRHLLRDPRHLDCIPTADLLELLTEVSPDVSRALWDLLRLCNPGHTTRALTVGPDPKVHDQGQLFLDAFEQQLGELYGSFNVIVNRLFADAFLRGSFVAELVLDAAGRLPVDLATPDGRWIYFQVVLDEQRGPVWQPFQWLYGEKVVLDRPTFRYVPVDPLPGKPTGRPMCSPALFSCLFLIGMLHDLKRVVQQQGYPRMDIAVSLEQLAQSMPPDLLGDTDKTRAWLTSAVAEIAASYQQLQPDDCFVHTDVSTLNRPQGTLNDSALGAVGPLIEALERQLTRALKSAPFLMGSTESTTETQSNRQFESLMASVESLQQLAEGLMEHMYSLGLRAAGIPAVAHFRFKVSRRSELLRDEQANALKISNAATAYARGWLSQTEACQMAMDKDKPDQEEPRIPSAGIGSGGAAGNPATAQPTPGINRSLLLDLQSAESPTGNGVHSK